jgi:hypothetical protein
MPTTLFLRDRLGRKLTNGTPGTTQATDFLGVAVGSGTTDSIGCLLIAKKWAISTVTAIGDYDPGRHWRAAPGHGRRYDVGNRWRSDRPGVRLDRRRWHGDLAPDQHHLNNQRRGRWSE